MLASLYNPEHPETTFQIKSKMLLYIGVPICSFNYFFVRLTRFKSLLSQYNLVWFQIYKENFTEDPTNCFDLLRLIIGHYLNGYYLVKNANGNIENIFCKAEGNIHGQLFLNK